MILNLVKKEFLLGKKYIPLTLVLVVIVPFIIASSDNNLMSAAAFILTALYAELILGQQIAMTEMKYKKAEALLCVTPYTRAAIVIGKYVFFLVIFLACCLLYGILSFILPAYFTLSFGAVSVAFLLSSLVQAIHTPIQFKLGVEKTKFFFMAVLMLASFGAPAISGLIPAIQFSFLSKIPVIVLDILPIFISMLLLIASTWVSIKIYSNKEV